MNADFQRIMDAINSAAGDMTEEEMLFHPAGKWSSAQIFEHLSLAFSGTVKGFERCIAAEKLLGGTQTLRQRLGTLVVLDLGIFPPGRPAPSVVVPKGKMGGIESLAAIRASLLAMDEAMARCQEKFAGAKGAIMDHPVLGPLTFAQWPRFHWVHTRHHMKQVHALRAAQRS